MAYLFARCAQLEKRLLKSEDNLGRVLARLEDLEENVFESEDGVWKVDRSEGRPKRGSKTKKRNRDAGENLILLDIYFLYILGAKGST